MKEGCCVHFNGIINETCEAKINYRTLVGGDDFGWATRMPCWKKNKSDVVCEKYSEPTKQQLKEHQEMINQEIEKMMKVAPLVKKIKNENKGKGTNGKDTCPICGNEIFWSHASINGHVWMKCKTENCIAFME